MWFQKQLAKTLAARYSTAHPDLCWICFDLDRKCHHVASRWSELVRKLQETVVQKQAAAGAASDTLFLKFLINI